MKYFFHDIRGNAETVARKGIEVKDTYEAALQSYHAYMGAYAYGHDANTTFVSCFITDSNGATLKADFWKADETQEGE